MSYTLNRTGAQIDGIFEKVDSTFFAVYGTTTYAEIGTAITAGKRVFLFKGAQLYGYIGIDGTNSAYIFGQLNGSKAQPGASYIYCATDSSWGEDLVPLATLEQFYASLMEDTASGSIASFPDGAEGVPVKELTADIEPIQDLHGYDNPWPPAGNKNLFDPSVFSGRASYTVNSNGTITVISADTAVWGDITALALKAGTYTIHAENYTSGNYQYTTSEDGYTTAEYVGYSSSSTFTLSADGGIKVKFGTGGATLPQTIKVQIEAGNEATSFVPYANICPISGYTGAEINVTGINVWDEEWEVGDFNGTTGQKISGTGIIPKDYIPVKPNTNYYYSCGHGDGAWFFFYDVNHTYLYRAQVASGSNVQTYNAHYVNFKVYDTYGTTYHYDVSLNYPATDHNYHSGTDNATYPVSWSDHGTIYKGTAEYKCDGEWEITDLVAADDMGDLTWTYTSSNQRMVATLPTPAESTGGGRSVKDLLSSMFEADITSDIGDNGKMFRNGQNIYVYTDETDPDAFKTAVTGQTLLYPLATPVTFTVSGPDPETLLGDNNIFSSTGDVDVRYRCNTALYIEKKLGE